MLTKQHETKTVLDLTNLYENGTLDLSPAFQRRSVWKKKDRESLIDTVVRNYPVPAIFLYRTVVDDQLRYSVIDGKQRLETLLGFLGCLRGRQFEVKLDAADGTGVQRVSAKSMRNVQAHKELRNGILAYKIPVIEIEGSLSDVIEVFVRLNSTGKALTTQEKRKAKYSGSPLLLEATRLADRLETLWKDTGVITQHHLSRMKHVELAAELIVSMLQGGVINKKAAVDRVMADKSLLDARLRKASVSAREAVRQVGKLFPDLHTTRFSKLVDYYSLVVLVARLGAEGAVLDDRKRQRLAWDLLRAFGVEVDRVREAQRTLTASGEASAARDYLLTVSQMTDDISQRRRRDQLLEAVIGSVFAKKDEKRGFTPEQRRILWNTTAEKSCTDCGDVLDWTNFTIDHVSPHSKGGRSILANAALMCRSCNSSKGNRQPRPVVKRASRAARPARKVRA